MNKIANACSPPKRENMNEKIIIVLTDIIYYMKREMPTFAEMRPAEKNVSQFSQNRFHTQIWATENKYYFHFLPPPTHHSTEAPQLRRTSLRREKNVYLGDKSVPFRQQPFFPGRSITIKLPDSCHRFALYDCVYLTPVKGCRKGGKRVGLQQFFIII